MKDQVPFAILLTVMTIAFTALVTNDVLPVNPVTVVLVMFLILVSAISMLITVSSAITDKDLL